MASWYKGPTSGYTKFGSKKGKKHADFACIDEDLDLSTMPRSPIIRRQKKERPTVYPSMTDQLAGLGRRLCTVPPDGNCLFESIARQLGGTMTHRELRTVACERGMQNPELFEGFLETDNCEEYLCEVERLQANGVWNVDVGDLAIAMVQSVLQEKIVVIRNKQRFHVIPDDGLAINDDTIVIVQDDLQTHYDATELCHWDNGSRAYGTAAQQIGIYGRVIDPVPVSGNCLFEAILRQLKHKDNNTQPMREFVARRGKAHAGKFCYLFDYRNDERGEADYLERLERLREDGYWDPYSDIIILSILADQLEVKFVVVGKSFAPIHVPDDNLEVDDKTIVLVKDGNFDYLYEATKRNVTVAGKTGYGSPIEQLLELGREVVPQPHDENSFFKSIASQLLRVSDRLLRGHCCNISEAAVKNYCHLRFKELPDEEILAEFSEFRCGEWKPKLRDLFLATLCDNFNFSAMIVYDQSRPQYFRCNRLRVDASTVVIVENHSPLFVSRFHGSKLLEPSEYSSDDEIRVTKASTLGCFGNLLSCMDDFLSMFSRKSGVTTKDIPMQEFKPQMLSRPTSPVEITGRQHYGRQGLDDTEPADLMSFADDYQSTQF